MPPSFPFTVVDIQSRRDPLLLPWLDLYEAAFPPEERPPTSHLLAYLADLERVENTGTHIAAVLNASQEFSGLLHTYQPPGQEAAFLWYFAVMPAARSQGLGRLLFQWLLEQLEPQVKALIFDIEDPHDMLTPEAAALACRRIEFYRRMGALQMEGVRYVQQVAEHQPPISPLLMVHPLVPLTAHEAYALAKPVLGSALEQDGELALV